MQAKILSKTGLWNLLPLNDWYAGERKGGWCLNPALNDTMIDGVGEDVNENTVEVLISRLRKKLSVHGVQINMVRGLGYYLKADLCDAVAITQASAAFAGVVSQDGAVLNLAKDIWGCGLAVPERGCFMISDSWR